MRFQESSRIRTFFILSFYFFGDFNIVATIYYLILSDMFFDFSLISTAHAISSSSDSLIGGQVYELEDVIRVSIALIVLMAGMLSVFFIVW